MTQRPIAASEFTRFNSTAQSILQQYGGVPVNDVFLPLWQKNPAVWVLRGGRGGGKSESVCDYLIKECRTEAYFKCYYGRKVFDTVRGSCFETLVACIKKAGLENEFHYSEANTSSMIITHRATGNKFIPFGSDKAEKLKSIKDPTHIWCEELPEFQFEDFKELFPTLRTSRGKNQFIATLNAYSIFTDHWIIKLFFPEQYTGQDKGYSDILDGIDVETIFANYGDNYFIDKEAYKRSLWLASAGNQSIFEGLANGAWGVVENKHPWLYAFESDKHVEPIKFLPSFDLYITFDFNNEPFECSVWQHSPDKGRANSFIHCIKEFSGNYKIEEMCARILAAFPASIIHITGDRSGKNEDLGRNQTLYQLIAGHLNIPNRMIDTPNANLEHSDSRLLCNAMLHNYPNFYVDPSCVNLIRQMQLATVDMNATTPSKLLKDRDVYKMDVFDSFRYYLQTYFNTYAKEKYFRVKK